jgi:hypothetical protein
MGSTTGVPDAVVVAAVVYLAATLVIAGFQVALALGAPWGEYAMGGAFPGRFPPPMRVAALVQGVVLIVLAVVVLSRAGLVAPSFVRDLPWLAWLPVAVAAISVAMNAASRSPRERRLWVPVGLVLLASSLVVALAAG